MAKFVAIGLILASFMMSATASACSYSLSQTIENMGVSIEKIREFDSQFLQIQLRLIEDGEDPELFQRDVMIKPTDQWEPVRVDIDGTVHIDFGDRRLGEGSRIAIDADCKTLFKPGVSLSVRSNGKSITMGRIKSAINEYKLFRESFGHFKRFLLPRVDMIKIYSRNNTALRCTGFGYAVAAEAKSVAIDLNFAPVGGEIVCEDDILVRLAL
ncbi:MAG: hypothetical protein AAFN91_12795 [Pseudomonadota bacterium]